MPLVAHELLSPWESFYVIVGSSAAALIGLQFVVIVLSSDRQSHTNSHQVAAFGTPNVVHFSAAFIVAAILSAPWHSLNLPRAMFAVMGVAGLLYAFVVMYRARKQTAYTLVLEDWVWHMLLPGVAYLALGLSAFFTEQDPEHALFVTGFSVLAMLLIGIHNAWDTVTYIASMPPTEMKSEKCPVGQAGSVDV